MLTKTKKITIEGKSVVDGVKIATFMASIDSECPSDISFSSYQNNKAAYKDNRVAVRADEAEFEDYVYSIQDQMLAEVEPEDTAIEAE